MSRPARTGRVLVVHENGPLDLNRRAAHVNRRAVHPMIPPELAVRHDAAAYEPNGAAGSVPAILLFIRSDVAIKRTPLERGVPVRLDVHRAALVSRVIDEPAVLRDEGSVDDANRASFVGELPNLVAVFVEVCLSRWIFRIVTVAPSSTRTKSLESYPVIQHPVSPHTALSLSMTRSRLMYTPAWVHSCGVVMLALSVISPSVASLTAASNSAPVDTSTATAAGAMHVANTASSNGTVAAGYARARREPRTLRAPVMMNFAPPRVPMPTVPH